MNGIGDLRRALTVGFRAFAADPVEVALNVEARIAERKELRAKRLKGGGFMPWPPCPYDTDQDWERRLHEMLGAPWPCPVSQQFWELWFELVRSLEGKGLKVGRGAFGGWADGESGLARAVWCLTHHVRPLRVVETGVARGITTRFVLEAASSNNIGDLWSVDLPPLHDRTLHEQTGAAVPSRLRQRWTYVRGSSRRRLPHLLAQLREIDLFIHDSRHTQRNLLFELQHAWKHLKPMGVVVVDDVDLNCGFHLFRSTHPDHPALICPAEPLRPDQGRQDDRGVFGIVRKVNASAP